jgi:hypothetical protein
MKLFVAKVYVIVINFLLALENALAFFAMEWNSMLKNVNNCLKLTFTLTWRHLVVKALIYI